MSDLIFNALSRALSWQVTQFTLAFVLAWRTIRPDIFREIGLRLAEIRDSVQQVSREVVIMSEAVTKDLDATSKRISLIENGHLDIQSSLDLIDRRLSALEGEPKEGANVGR